MAAEGPLPPKELRSLKRVILGLGKWLNFCKWAFFWPSTSQRGIFNSNLFGGFSTDFEPIWVSSTFHIETWTTTHGKSEFWYMSRYSRYNMTKETYWAFRTLGWKLLQQTPKMQFTEKAWLPLRCIWPMLWPVVLPHIGNLALLKPSTLLTNQHPRHPQHPQHAPRNEVIHHILLPIGTLQELRKPLLHLRASGTLQHNPHRSKKKESSYGMVLPWRSLKLWRTERRKPREETKKAWLNLASITRGVLCLLDLGGLTDLGSRIPGGLHLYHPLPSFEASKNGAPKSSPQNVGKIPHRPAPPPKRMKNPLKSKRILHHLTITCTVMHVYIYVYM